MKKTIESARGLVAITRTSGSNGFHLENVSPGKSALKGPLPKELAQSLLAAITDFAKKTIEGEGHDLEKWPELLHRDAISPGYCAARILLETEKVARLLGRLESEYVPNERRRHIPKRKRPRKNVPKRLQRLAFEAVHAALVTAFEMQMLAGVQNEAAIESHEKRMVPLDAENKERAENAGHAALQAMADEIWEKEPTLKKNAVAKMVHKRMAAPKKAVGTIRKVIKKNKVG